MAGSRNLLEKRFSSEPKGFQELECLTVSRELLAPLSAVFTSANGSKSYSI